jgi:hypothetical protein
MPWNIIPLVGTTAKLDAERDLVAPLLLAHAWKRTGEGKVTLVELPRKEKVKVKTND